MLDLSEVDRLMKSAGIAESKVLRMAGLCPRYLYKMRRGLVRANGVNLQRIRLAIARLKRGETNPHEVKASGSFRLAVAYVAMFLSLQPEQILAADPSRRATADEAWMKAAVARRWALYIANQYLGVPQAELARAAGMSKAAVSIAMNDVEDERGQLALEQLLKAVEQAFS